MRRDTFAGKIEQHLCRGNLRPPIVGELGHLRIAAALVRNETYDGDVGVLLLANKGGESTGHPRNYLCLKVVGACSLGRRKMSVQPWNVEAKIAIAQLCRLVDPSTIDAITDEAMISTSPAQDVITSLLVSNLSGDCNIPTLNNKPLRPIVGWDTIRPASTVPNLGSRS